MNKKKFTKSYYMMVTYEMLERNGAESEKDILKGEKEFVEDNKIT